MRQELLATTGVVDATVSYDRALAVVHYRAEETTAGAIARAVDATGFRAQVTESEAKQLPDPEG